MSAVLLLSVLLLPSQPPSVPIPKGWTNGSPGLDIEDNTLLEIRTKFENIGKRGETLSSFAVLETADERLAFMAAFEQRRPVDIEKYKNGFDEKANERGGSLIKSEIINVNGVKVHHAITVTASEVGRMRSEIITLPGEDAYTAVLFTYEESMTNRVSEAVAETIKNADGLATPPTRVEHYIRSFKMPNPMFFLFLVAPFLLLFEWKRKRSAKKKAGA